MFLCCNYSDHEIFLAGHLQKSPCQNYSCVHRSAHLDIRSCLYNDILKEEEASSLLECCCCSQDSVWCVTAACLAC